MYLFSLRRQFVNSFNAPNIDNFLSKGNEIIHRLSPVVVDYSGVPVDVVNSFNEIYTEMKKCSLINTIIVTFKNLIPHKK